jgi:predicted PurR-regulated permease PerM
MPNEQRKERAIPTAPRGRGRRVFFALGLALLGLIILFLLRRFATTLLLIFAAILFGVFLEGLTTLVRKWTRLPRTAALTVIVVFLLGASVAFSCLAGPHVVEQGRALVDELPKSLGIIQSRLQQHEWGRSLLSTLPALDDLTLSFGSILGSVAQAFSITLELLGAIVFIFFVGLYLAAEPEMYRDSILLLVSPAHRARGREVIAKLGQALRWWLLGRFITMTLMGLLTALALWLAHVPLVFVLAVIAGLFLFVPYLGAVAAAIPAMLIGLMESPARALVIAAIYTGVHVFEGYAITPFVQKRAVALPPALLLTVQVFAAALFGIVGIILSTPLTVVAIVLIQTLYVQDVLGEDVAVLGEHDGDGTDTPPD